MYLYHFSCRKSYAISQLAIGGEGSTNYCSKEITDDNWSDTHKFSVAARTDFVMDGDHRRNVTIVMRKVVDGRSVETRVVCDVNVSV